MIDSEIIDKAVAIMALRSLERRRLNTHLPPIVDARPWLAKTEHTIATNNANTLAHLTIHRYTPEELADRLENGPRKLVTPTPAGWRSDKPHCRTCEGNTWVYAYQQDGYEFVKRCPTCWSD